MRAARCLGLSLVVSLLVLGACSTAGDGATGNTADPLDAAPMASDSAAPPADSSDVKEAAAPCSLNVMIDPKNCGSCGHDCLGGACVSGTCQPIVIAADQVHPVALVVEGPDVFWVSGIAPNLSLGSVDQARMAFLRGTTTGAKPIELFAIESPPSTNYGYTQPIQVAFSDAGLVFAALAGAGASLYAPLPLTPSAGPVAVRAANRYFAAIIGDGPSVYYAGDGNIDLLAADGSIVRTLANGPTTGWVTAFAQDAARLYFGVSDGRVMSIAKAATMGTPTLLATFASQPVGLAVDGAAVYVAVPTTGSVKRIPKDGSSAPADIASAQNIPYALAVDESRIYWTNAGGGTVVSCPLVGCAGSPQVLATGQGTPLAIASDVRAVYWVDNTAGAVMKVAK